MAILNQGFFVARGSISTNTDTTPVAAVASTDIPVRGVYVLWATFTVSVAGSGSRLIFNDAPSGNVIARFATVTADAILNLNYTTTYKEWPGNQVVGININTTGAGAATVNYEIAYQVK